MYESRREGSSDFQTKKRRCCAGLQIVWLVPWRVKNTPSPGDPMRFVKNSLEITMRLMTHL